VTFWTILRLVGRATSEAANHEENDPVCSHLRERNARDLPLTLQHALAFRRCMPRLGVGGTLLVENGRSEREALVAEMKSALANYLAPGVAHNIECAVERQKVVAGVLPARD
jgi:hypothetical protein